jgi:hypothetical protein
MTLVVICNCHRHLRFSFFLTLWMFSYVQMIDQLRMDLSDLRCNSKNLQNTSDTSNH